MVCQPLFCITIIHEHGISFDLCIFFVYKYLCCCWFSHLFVFRAEWRPPIPCRYSLLLPCLCCFSFNIACTKLNHNVKHIKKTLYIAFKWKLRGRTETKTRTKVPKTHSQCERERERYCWTLNSFYDAKRLDMLAIFARNCILSLL